MICGMSVLPASLTRLAKAANCGTRESLSSAAHEDVGELLGHGAVGGLVVHAHRRHGDAVLQRRSAKLQRGEDLRIFHISDHVVTS